jgi:hypothetical protein
MSPADYAKVLRRIERNKTKEEEPQLRQIPDTNYSVSESRKRAASESGSSPEPDNDGRRITKKSKTYDGKPGPGALVKETERDIVDVLLDQWTVMPKDPSE